MSGTWESARWEGFTLKDDADLESVRVSSEFLTAGENAPGSRLMMLSGPGLCAIALLAIAGVWTEQPLFVLACSLMLAAGLVARAWASLALVSLECRRSLSATRAFPGDTVTLSLTLDNAKPLPLAWARAEERLHRLVAPADRPVDPTGHRLHGRVGFATPLGAYESATWSCPLLCRRRGWYPIGPGRVISGDLFGLHLKAREASGALPLIVYPKLYDLPELGLPSRHPLGEARDVLRLFEDASRPWGLRDYSSDTPFKSIAWSASARQGTLYAKTFEPTVTLQTVVFLAVDRFDVDEMRGEGPEVFEHAISTAASLANRLTELRQPVGLFVNGALADGPGPVVLGAGRGDNQLECMLESLAKLRRRTAVPFDRFLRSHSDRLTGGTTLAVIAARLDELDLDQLVALRRRGCGVLVLIVGGGAMPEGLLACRRILAPEGV